LPIQSENRAIRPAAEHGAAETALDQNWQATEPDRFASVCPRISLHRRLFARLDGLLDAPRRWVSGEPRQKLAQSVASVVIVVLPYA
jgi:hypothetical protein